MNNFTSTAPVAAKSVKEEWAVKVNVSEPVKDFHKRVPDMAHKVRALYSFLFPCLFSLQVFFKFSFEEI